MSDQRAQERAEAARADREAVRATLSAGPEAFTPLVVRYQKRVGNLILRMVGNRHEADELTQDAFLRAYENLARYDERYPFLPWLLRVAHNLTVNHLARRRVKACSFDDEADETAQKIRQHAASTADPERASLDRERCQTIASALAVLPERYRILMLYRYWLGLGYEEMAYVTGRPAARIKYLLNYGRGLLHEILLEMEGLP